MNAAIKDSAPYWDPYDPGFFADPYPSFRRLREEAPVYYNEKYDFYAVSRYADVERGLTDKVLFSSARGDILEMIKDNVPVPYGSFIHEDPPVHTAHRRVLTQVFTAKKMAALEPQIRQFCAKALDPLVAGGEFDFIANLGADMPMREISMLLGIPGRPGRTRAGRRQSAYRSRQAHGLCQPDLDGRRVRGVHRLARATSVR